MAIRYVTNQELVVKYRGQWPDPKWEGIDVTIPKGHPVLRLEMGTPPGFIYKADQPSKLIDAKTFGPLLHDATYYGIKVPYDAVEEVREGEH